MVFMEQLGAIILLFLLVMCILLLIEPINVLFSKWLKINLEFNKKAVRGFFIGLVSGSLVYILAVKVNVWVINFVIFCLIVVFYIFPSEK